MAEKLFSEFPPVPTEKWEEVIVKDLKGADYEKKLVWRTMEGFTVRPYYRAEDLKDLKWIGIAPGEFPYVRGTKKDNNWQIHQGVCACDGDFARANAEALTDLKEGVESVGFYIDGEKVLTAEDFKTLLSGIDITATRVYFCGCCLKTIDTLRNFVRYADALGVDKEQVRAIFDYNPLYALTSKGYWCADKSFELLKEAVGTVKDYKRVKVICVEATIFNGAGANSTQELAFALAQGSEYLSRLTELGLTADEAAGRMVFSFAVANVYFMEIAKFRAARMLWANITEAYGCRKACPEKMYIHATTSEWNQTVYDPYVNMLRGTTEAMSAVLAGVNALEVLPFDFAFRVPNEFSNRISHNVQLILKEEAHFNKVTDPAAGSYYVENLTAKLADSAWTLFRQVEEKGGYVACFMDGFVQSEIKAVSDKRDKNIAVRRETLLGTNQFPNFLEKADKCITAETVSRNVPTLMGMVLPADSHEKVAQPLEPYRGAEAFEALRLATDRSGKEPKAFMLTYGNLAMCRARAQFSSNFFAVAGIRVMDNNRFSTIEEGVEAAIASGAEIVVACSSDDEYAEGVPQIAKLLGDKAILVVAGAPACQPDLEAQGIHNFISVKSNVLETLRGYQAQLGIKAI